MENEVVELLKNITLSSIKIEDKLWEDRKLDSISVVDLIIELENKYNIKITHKEVTLENFNDVHSICNLIKNKLI